MEDSSDQPVLQELSECHLLRITRGEEMSLTLSGEMVGDKVSGSCFSLCLHSGLAPQFMTNYPVLVKEHESSHPQ